MAVSELIYIWLGSVAVLASIGMFVPMDGFSELVLPFVSAILWGVVSLLSLDVLAGDSLESIEIMPIFWLAGAFAMASAVLGVYYLVRTPAKEVDERTGGGIDL